MSAPRGWQHPGTMSGQELVRELESGCPNHDERVILNCLFVLVGNLEREAKRAREDATRAQRDSAYLVPRLVRLAPANAKRKTVPLDSVRELWQAVVNGVPTG